MNWFYLALIAPLFWSVANYIDKYLLSKYVKNGGIGSLILFSCFFALVALPIIYILENGVVSISITDITLLIVVGVANTLGVLFYLYALNEDETSVIVPLFQLTPIFGFIFSYFLFGEILNLKQVAATIFIIVGAMMVSVRFTNHGIKMKFKVLMLMSGCTILFGLHGSLFKMVASRENFMVSLFWEYIGLLLAGVILFTVFKSYRIQFIEMIKNNTRLILSLNMLNEILVLLGNMITAMSFTLAPVTLVLAVGNFQPLFAILIGLVLSIFFPNIEREDIQLSNLIYKLISVCIIVLGGYLLSVS